MNKKRTDFLFKMKRQVMPKVRKITKIKPLRKIKRKRKKKEVTKKDITVSKLEKRFQKYMKDFGIQLEDQFRIAWKWFDFIVKDTNIIVEVDGDYYHCNPAKYPSGPETNMQRKNIENDLYKNALAAANGYTLIRIWENDFNNDPEKVKRRILEAVKKHKTIEDKTEPTNI